MRVENIVLEALHKRVVNPNVMEPQRYRALVEAVRRGFYEPLLVRPNNGSFEIINGAHRLDAATEVGLAKLPCVIVEMGDNEAEAQQLAMSVLRGSPDLTVASSMIADLRANGFDVELPGVLGFSLDELHILENMTLPDEDVMAGGAAMDEPEPPSDTTPPLGEFPLEVVFNTKKARDAAKRKLSKLGEGDLARGLAMVLA